jgi:hypothetical protein
MKEKEKDLPASKPPPQDQNASGNLLSLGQHLKNQLQAKKNFKCMPISLRIEKKTYQV